jgi:hypothetical protein
MASAADFLLKLKHERADFIHSKCMDARHAINAVMTGYHLHEWVFRELSARQPSFSHKSHKAFRASLAPTAGSLLEDPGRIADGTKHFLPKKIKTGEHDGAFDRSAFQANAFDVPHLWLEREDGRKQRAEDFIDELVQFWEGFFEAHSLTRFAEGAEPKPPRKRCCIAR